MTTNLDGYHRWFDKNIAKKYTFPLLFIWHQHHGDQYFLINDLDDLMRTSVFVLQSLRNDEGWFEPPTIPKQESGFGAYDDILQLPEGKIKDLAKKEWDKDQDKQKQYDIEMTSAIEAQTAIEKKDGKSAYAILTMELENEIELRSFDGVRNEYD